jgi:hypothetical protein
MVYRRMKLFDTTLIGASVAPTSLDSRILRYNFESFVNNAIRMSTQIILCGTLKRI